MFLITIPHSGELIPPETPWLENLPEEVIMCDVDRYVDKLYIPAAQKLKIPAIATQWHRYAGDLNRFPEDIDADSVLGCNNPAGSFTRGFHWVKTTQGFTLQKKPMTTDNHQALVQRIHDPFHEQIQQTIKAFKFTEQKDSASPPTTDDQSVYHLDVHSMPSLGTKMHRDPGEVRAEIVISDCEGKSCSSKFRDLVIVAYVIAGFKVAYNWPYLGGRMTEQYGAPDKSHHCVQVELRRDLYMDEKTKCLIQERSQKVEAMIFKAMNYIINGVK